MALGDFVLSLCAVLLSLDMTDSFFFFFYFSVGGEIQSLAWDPTGERLAVLLKGLAFTPSDTFDIVMVLFVFIFSNEFSKINLFCSNLSVAQAIQRRTTGQQS